MTNNRVSGFLWAGLLLLSACTSGGNVPPPYDNGPPDGVADGPIAPDLGPTPDKGPKPDKGPNPDLGPKPDAGLCGNKKVDEPVETCDKAITAGSEGACPQSAADCNDGNQCTSDSVKGSVASCTAECDYAPVSNCCGNGLKEGSEECDDGNVVDKDGCSNQCKLPGGHPLLTEVATSPSEAEFVEIYNPTSGNLALDDYYLADRNDYFLVVGTLSGGSTDFVARFPPGTTIAAGGYLVVALDGLKFKIAYGKAPDFELVNGDTTVPDMVAPMSKAIGSQAGLTDGGELVVLFTWDGTSDLVQDVDYVVWKGSAATAVYKSSTICVDGPDADSSTSCFLDDTNVTLQSYLPVPQQGGSLHRCNYLEGTEKSSGGNGLTGHDETSEPLDGVGATWKRNPKTLKLRTPGGPAPIGFCPP